MNQVSELEPLLQEIILAGQEPATDQELVDRDSQAALAGEDEQQSTKTGFIDINLRTAS